MIQSRFNRPNMAMSLAESEVLEGLKLLPGSYRVHVSPDRIQLNDDWEGGTSSSYEPDFVVINPLGKQLVVEVKSESSLSLVNMVRFVAIDKRIRESGGGFLLLVCGSGGLKSRARAMPEFKKLHIHFVNSPSDVVMAIENEFSDLAGNS